MGIGKYVLYNFSKTTSKDADDIDLLKLLQWTLKSANKFFSKLYKEGIWMNQDIAQSIFVCGFDSSDSCLHNPRKKNIWGLVMWNPTNYIIDILPTAQEGYAGLASLCHSREWALFRIRPKLHLYTHSPTLSFLGSFFDIPWRVTSCTPLLVFT